MPLQVVSKTAKAAKIVGLQGHWQNCISISVTASLAVQQQHTYHFTVIVSAAVDSSNQEPTQMLYQECPMYHDLLPFTLPLPVQVRWAKWSLERVRVKAGRGEAGRPLEHGDVLAHQLSHFVNTLHQFVMDRLLHGAWMALEQVNIATCNLLCVEYILSCATALVLLLLLEEQQLVQSILGMTSSVKDAREISLEQIGMRMATCILRIRTVVPHSMRSHTHVIWHHADSSVYVLSSGIETSWHEWVSVAV